MGLRHGPRRGGGRKLRPSVFTRASELEQQDREWKDGDVWAAGGGVKDGGGRRAGRGQALKAGRRDRGTRIGVSPSRRASPASPALGPALLKLQRGVQAELVLRPKGKASRVWQEEGFLRYPPKGPGSTGGVLTCVGAADLTDPGRRGQGGGAPGSERICEKCQTYSRCSGCEVVATPLFFKHNLGIPRS